MSGRPTSAMLRDIVARWGEDPENTEVGMLCSPTGACAQGDILLIEGHYRRAVHPVTKTLELYHPERGWAAGYGDREVADILGITLEEAGVIRQINDTATRRPMEYLRMLAGQYEARERLAEAAGMVVGA